MSFLSKTHLDNDKRFRNIKNKIRGASEPFDVRIVIKPRQLFISAFGGFWFVLFFAIDKNGLRNSTHTVRDITCAGTTLKGTRVGGFRGVKGVKKLSAYETLNMYLGLKKMNHPLDFQHVEST